MNPVKRGPGGASDGSSVVSGATMNSDSDKEGDAQRQDERARK